jgi:hypothetical protein
MVSNWTPLHSSVNLRPACWVPSSIPSPMSVNHVPLNAVPVPVPLLVRTVPLPSSTWLTSQHVSTSVLGSPRQLVLSCTTTSLPRTAVSVNSLIALSAITKESVSLVYQATPCRMDLLSVKCVQPIAVLVIWMQAIVWYVMSVCLGSSPTWLWTPVLKLTVLFKTHTTSQPTHQTPPSNSVTSVPQDAPNALPSISVRDA